MALGRPSISFGRRLVTAKQLARSPHAHSGSSQMSRLTNY